MMGMEGAWLVPLLILGSALILYFGLISTRRRQLERRERAGEAGAARAGTGEAGTAHAGPAQPGTGHVGPEQPGTGHAGPGTPGRREA